MKTITGFLNHKRIWIQLVKVAENTINFKTLPFLQNIDPQTAANGIPELRNSEKRKLYV